METNKITCNCGREFVFHGYIPEKYECPKCGDIIKVQKILKEFKDGNNSES